MLLATAFVLLAIAAPKADADVQAFCQNVWMDPYGSQYDNCGAWEQHWNAIVQVSAQEHSACVSTTTTGWKSGLNASWSCTAGSYETTIKYVSPKAFTYGIIRNNTTGSGNHATGVQNWCAVYNCGM